MNWKHITAVLIVLAIVFLFWKKSQAKTKSEPVYIGPSGGFITYGSKGDDVRDLQVKLNELIREANNKKITMYCDLTPTGPMVTVGLLTEDGIFGSRTAAAMQCMFGTTGIWAEQIAGLTFNGAYGSTIHTMIGRS